MHQATPHTGLLHWSRNRKQQSARRSTPGYPGRGVTDLIHPQLARLALSVVNMQASHKIRQPSLDDMSAPPLCSLERTTFPEHTFKASKVRSCLSCADAQLGRTSSQFRVLKLNLLATKLDFIMCETACGPQAAIGISFAGKSTDSSCTGATNPTAQGLVW